MKTYSVKEIAELLNTNPETVRRWIRSGKLEAIQDSRKEGNVVTQAMLDSFLKTTPKYAGALVAGGMIAGPLVGLTTLAAGVMAGANEKTKRTRRRRTAKIFATKRQRYPAGEDRGMFHVLSVTKAQTKRPAKRRPFFRRMPDKSL